ncbi:outer membrane receptor for ferrienterochelin and colicin [Pontibacter aydingkolensis]|uniref:TonB-dependent receptor n=1 Tax=Pontibacter aydingkolensis TaxID=1911536 RepID=A0ABS7CUG1_9BACT|nr:TonB-dependent receptor [Pontibacter aydingkolensis]MBW7467494.1 TonB-dependent receptor [Pontibacter aydingkolensis]
MKKLFTLALLFCCTSLAFAQSKYTLSGYVREKGSGELLIGVSVYQPGTTISTSTNTYGFYSLTLPAKDSVTLTFGYLGYKPEIRKVSLRQSLELNIELQSEATLKEVEVVAERVEKVSQAVDMSKIEVPISQIKSIPALLGEKDVMKVLQLMPGVQSGSEGNSGIYVRGGGPDQNLIILDDATVYNASHLFGFFSLFNGDALKSVELTKGGFPARYGGRLSSVIDLNMKDGNKEELHGEGGIGLISSRLMLEGPLSKGKSSFLISGRRTYADVLARPFMDIDGKAGYYFYDLNTKVNYDFGQKNKLYLSGYFGRDRFFFREKYDDGESEGGIHWGNATGTLRWNHLFSNKVFANTSLVFSRYRFNIFASEEDDEKDEKFKLDYFSSIQDVALKYDLDYLPNPQHSIKAGFQSTFHRFTPSALVIKDSQQPTIEQESKNVDGVESSVYVEDTYKPTPALRINAGLRLSHFAADKKSYFMPEPRLAAAYSIKEDLAVKASYARMNQYVHLISNTGIGLPTDLWVPTTDKLKPQTSQQIAVGIAKDFLKKDLALTIEGYYKKSNNIIGYKEGASFMVIDDPETAEEVSWENNITAGQGWSYGVEFLLQKKVGRFSGWAGYTLSWTQLQFDSLNYGKKFYARYDRRHDISLVGIYELSKGVTLSGTWVYGTGNAITMPVGTYESQHHLPSKYKVNSYSYYGGNAVDYGDRNSFRMAAYHRMDIGIQFHKQKKWGERTWEISFYNAYNRRNPFFYYIEEDNNGTTSESKLKQITLFPIIPSVTYGFKF